MTRVWPELFLLRHGETTWNVARRLQGRRDAPLTPRGEAQALAMGALLAAQGVTADRFAFWTSPLGRARRTAELALGPFGGPLREDERLAEIGLGDWEGLDRDEIEARWPGAFAEDDPILRYADVPGGERLAAVDARCRSFLGDLAGPAVIVTHGAASRFLRGVLLDLPLEVLGTLPGGQGVVYHHRAGRVERLDPGT